MTQQKANSQMSFGAAVSTCFRKYATFKGRARRSEYWYWALFQILLGFVLIGIDYSAGLIVLDALLFLMMWESLPRFLAWWCSCPI